MPARKEKSRSNFISCREAFALISKLVSMPLGQGLQSDQQFTATFREMTPNKRITLFYRFISLLQSSNDKIYIYICVIKYIFPRQFLKPIHNPLYIFQHATVFNCIATLKVRFITKYTLHFEEIVRSPTNSNVSALFIRNTRSHVPRWEK